MKCSFWCSHVSRLESPVFLWPPHLSCLQPCLVTPPWPIILIPLVHSIGFLCITEFIHFSFLSKTFTFCLAFTLSFCPSFAFDHSFPVALALSTSIWAVGRDVTKFLALETSYFCQISITHACTMLSTPAFRAPMPWVSYCIQIPLPITIASCHVIVLRCTLRLIS